jgi:hypothetical protein
VSLPRHRFPLTAPAGRSQLLVVFLAGWAAACGGSVKTNPLPGGGYVVACEKGINACIGRAEVLCGDRGYTIVGGESTSKVVGGPNSAYRKVIYSGELSFYCGKFDAPKCEQGPVADENQVYQLSGAETSAPAPEPVAPAPLRACVPGSTQTCVGPGACAGGQVCAADGQGFGPCDCGNTAPAEAPDAPSAAQP